jgi:hypothetical protein
VTSRITKAPKDDRIRPWDERPVSRERWQKYRGDLMQWSGRQGRRPPEWWVYEKQMDPPKEPGDEHAALFEMGELLGDELAFMMQHWREAYDLATSPGFVVHTGPGKVLEGAEARRAHIRWAGIPPAILRQLAEEKATA